LTWFLSPSSYLPDRSGKVISASSLRVTVHLRYDKEVIETLIELPLLRYFEEKDLDVLVSLSKLIKYEPGETIFKEGEFDNRLHFLVSGDVRITKQGQELRVLNCRWEVFGEMGITDNSARPASVYAVEETVCLALDASYISRLSGDDKTALSSVLYGVFAKLLASRLRITSEELIRAREEIAKIRSELNR